MRLGRDLVFGISASLVSLAATLVAVPFLIRALGVEAYGLIGFSTALQSFLMLLDLGLGPTISREIARSWATGDQLSARVLTRSLARVYWVIAIVIGVALVAISPLVAGHWLNAKALSTTMVTQAVALMGVQIAARWPSSLYLGVMNGAHKLVSSSMIGAAYYAIANLGAALLAAFYPKLDGYFIWQAVCGLGYTLALQIGAWRALGGARDARFDRQALRRIWRFSANMSGVALASVVLTQLDKIVLSKVISLTEFAHYMLAVMAVSVLYRFIAPVFNAIYPRFSALVAQNDEQRLEISYRVIGNIFACVWFPMIMGIAVCARPLLQLWTGNAALAADSAPLLSLIAIGTGLHGAMFFPYALQLAYGDSRLTLRIHLILVAVQLPTLLLLSLRLGVLGGAVAWLILYVAYALIATPLTHRRLLRHAGLAWAFADIGRPLAISSAAGLIAAVVLHSTTIGPFFYILVGAGFALAAVLTSISVSPHRLPLIKSVLIG